MLYFCSITQHNRQVRPNWFFWRTHVKKWKLMYSPNQAVQPQSSGVWRMLSTFQNISLSYIILTPISNNETCKSYIIITILILKLQISRKKSFFVKTLFPIIYCGSPSLELLTTCFTQLKFAICATLDALLLTRPINLCCLLCATEMSVAL